MGLLLKQDLKKIKCDCIFAIDGDGEYDVNILPELLKKLEKSDLVYKYKI